MTRSDVIKVITKELKTYSTANSISLITENVKFDFDSIDEFLELYFMSAYNSEVTLDGKLRLNGIAQINVNVPKDTGTSRALAIIEDLKNIYKTNGILTNDYGSVHLAYVYEDGGSGDSEISNVNDIYYTIYLTIEYKEFT